MASKKTAQGTTAGSKAKKPTSGVERNSGKSAEKSAGKAAGTSASKKNATPVAARRVATKQTQGKIDRSRAEAPPPIPSAMGLLISHVDYTTHNFEEVRRFYTQQLGFTKFQYDPSLRYLSIQTTPNSSLGFRSPSRRQDLPLPPREPTIYFMVRDIDEAYRKLQARGVSFEAPPETTSGHRVVQTRDPEGRNIILAQPIQTRK